MRNTWIVGVVCLVLGVAAGWFYGRMSQGEPNPSEPRTSKTVQAKSNEAEPPKPKDDSPQQPAPVQPAAKDVPEPKKADRPRPDSELAGVVINDDGTPCAGLKIRALPDMLEEVPSYIMDMWDVERRAAYAAEQVKKRFEDTAETTTGSDGTFKFEISEGRMYVVRSMDVDVLLLYSGNSYSYVRPPKTDMKLTALRLVPVGVEVKFEDGSAPATVNLSITRNGQPFQFARMPWTPQNTVFPMPMGKLVVKATDPKGTGIEGSSPLEVTSPNPKPSVSIVLRRPQGLTVTVVQPPVHYSEIRLLLLPEEKVRNDSFGAMEASLAGGGGQKIAPDKYFFKGTAKGGYVLFVTSRSSGLVLRKSLALEGESEEFTVELPPLERAGHIVVRLLSPDGKPVDGATLMMSLVHESITWGDFQLFAACGNGEYWLRRPEKDFAERGAFVPEAECELSIRAVHETWGSVYKRLAFSGIGEIEVKFVVLADVTVKVTNLPNTGLSDLVLSVFPEDANPNREAYSPTFLERRVTPSGESPQPQLSDSMTFRGVPVGRAKLTLFKRLRGGGSSGILLLSRDIVVATPQTAESISVPELYDLIVIPDQPLGRSELAIYSGAAAGTLLKQEDGSCIARQLPAGEYLINAGTRGYMRVTLPANGPVTLAPQPSNAYRLSRYDPEGVYYRAGLRIGDIIVSINGHTAEGYQAMRDLREKSASAATLNLEIRRGDQTLQISFTGNDWKQPWQKGEGLSGTLVK